MSLLLQKKKIVFVSVKMNVNSSSPGYWYTSENYSTVFFSAQYKLFGGNEIECVHGSTWGPFQEYFSSLILHNCCHIDCPEYKFILWLHASQTVFFPV